MSSRVDRPAPPVSRGGCRARGFFDRRRFGLGRGRHRPRRRQHVFARGGAIGDRLHRRRSTPTAASPLNATCSFAAEPRAPWPTKATTAWLADRLPSHLVQHVLDVPAEIAEGAGTDRAAAALGVWNTRRIGSIDPCPRLQAPGSSASSWRSLPNFSRKISADLVVDFLAGVVEAGHQHAGAPAPTATTTGSATATSTSAAGSATSATSATSAAASSASACAASSTSAASGNGQ